MTHEEIPQLPPEEAPQLHIPIKTSHRQLGEAPGMHGSAMYLTFDDGTKYQECFLQDQDGPLPDSPVRIIIDPDGRSLSSPERYPATAELKNFITDTALEHLRTTGSLPEWMNKLR